MSTAKKVAKDTYLFREGDAPDAMYIIKTGSFAVTKTKGASEVVLTEIKAGAMVGEMAIFDRKPRSANVKATKESEVVALPYEALEKQLDALPTWIKAIMRTMNENLRESNKKIKMLENPDADAERFPPHVVNKLISIINFVGLKYGQKEENGAGLLIPAGKIRNYTIQIFGEATNKMESMQDALKALGFLTIEDLGEGKKRMVNLKPDVLFDFVDWYNEWMYKQEREKISITAEESKVLDGLMFYARQGTPDAKGLTKINLNDIQNNSMKDLQWLLKPDDVNSLVEKKVVSEKVMAEGGLFVSIDVAAQEKPTQYWKIIWDLKKVLR